MRRAGNNGIRFAQYLHGLKATILANQLDYVASLAHRSWKKARLPQLRSDARIPQVRPSETKANMLLEHPGSRARLESFIDSAYCDPAIFDKARLRRLLQRQYEGREDFGHMLGLVLTFAAALPMFVYGRTVECPEPASPAAAARLVLAG